MPFESVFVIGQNKTGTTSMHHFLKALGLRHLSINEVVKAKYFEGNFEYLDYLTTKFHSFDDLPWNRLDVVEHYMRRPHDNRFILTTRDPNQWFDSLVRFNQKLGREIPAESEREEYIHEQVVLHNQRCRELALETGKQLLEINVADDDKTAQKITTFLDLPETMLPFPHANRTK